MDQWLSTRKRRLFVALTVTSSASLFIFLVSSMTSQWATVKVTRSSVMDSGLHLSLHDVVNAVERDNSSNTITGDNKLITVNESITKTDAELKATDAIKKSDSNPFGCLVTRPTADAVIYRTPQWQALLINESDTKHEVFLYSAFYDDRDDVGSDVRAIRILGVATGMEKLLFCQLWSEGFELPIIVAAQVEDNGRGHRIRDRFHGQHMWSCVLHNNAHPATTTPPTHVSLTARPCHQATTLIPVVHEPKTTTYAHEYGVCVPISFWWIDPVPLVEWIEANAMFGVGEINVYNCSISSPVDGVFAHYAAKKLVNVHQMPTPVFDWTWDGVSLGSAVSLNDCMMRNMFRYRYIVLLDFDEIIVPRKASNYVQMTEQIDSHFSTRHHASYSFRNAYIFQQNKTVDTTFPIYSRALRNRLRAQPSDFLYGTKSFVDPRRCFSVFNHYCWKFFPTDYPNPFTLDVPTGLALSHHYRFCHFEKETCDSLIGGAAVDDVMLKYSEHLLNVTRTTLRQLEIIGAIDDDNVRPKYIRPANLVNLAP